ncbi:MAG: cytochrome b/b6 domain-containing protein [Chitinivibrionales bacterium]|nr:cytochrome b/b6 domain-containing protein [Chitinivibrionales bacterium]
MKLLKTPTEHLTVPRFDKTERLLHWLNSAFYLLLLTSGFGLSYPSLRFLTLGHPKIILFCHVVVGMTLAVAILYVYFFKKRRITPAAWRGHFAYIASDKYNAGQKFNITLSVALLLVFLVSGILLLMGRFLPVALVKAAFCAHNWGVMLALPVILGHIFLSVIHPATNPSLHAMLVGKVEERYARHHHPKWFENIFRDNKTGGP